MTALVWVAVWAWLASVAAYGIKRQKAGDLLAALGIALALVFTASLWSSLGRPPMRTLGETRWLYATFVPMFGLLLGWRFEARSLTALACLMASAFVGINLAKPETMDRTLMPALQSPWFVPHVVVYMLAYAALGLSSLFGLALLLQRAWRREPISRSDVDLPHRLACVGVPLLTCGLVFGAFWAKEAWGHYWAWDPKETWAFLTWGVYLVYLHVHVRHPMRPSLNLAILGFGFGVMLLCWFGLNLMPIAAESVHTYTRAP